MGTHRYYVGYFIQRAEGIHVYTVLKIRSINYENHRIKYEFNYSHALRGFSLHLLGSDIVCGMNERIYVWYASCIPSMSCGGGRREKRGKVIAQPFPTSTSNHLSGCGVIAIKWVQRTILLHITVHSSVYGWGAECEFRARQFERLIKFPSCFSLSPSQIFWWRNGLRNAKKKMRSKLFCATLFSIILLASAGEWQKMQENSAKAFWRCRCRCSSFDVAFFFFAPHYVLSQQPQRGKTFRNICDVDAVFWWVLSLLLQTSTKAGGSTKKKNEMWREKKMRGDFRTRKIHWKWFY